MYYLTRTILLAACLAVLSGPYTFSQMNPDRDMFVVIVNDKRGFIDRTGKIVIEPKWGGANNFSEGLAIVATYEGGYRQGFIDATGKIVIEPQYVMASDFSEGLAAVGFGEFGLHNSGDHKTGFIDKTGRVVIKPKYRDAFSFSEGLSVVSDNGKYGFINKLGKLVIPLKFDDAESFYEGLACVKVGDKFGFIDAKGKFAIKPRYSHPTSFHEGLAAVVVGGRTNQSYGGYYNFSGNVMFIDHKGKVVIRLPKNAVEAGNFSEGLASVGVKGDKDFTYNGYIDKTGQFVIKPQFSSSEPFQDGLARIVLNPNFGFAEDGFGFIDRSGKIVMKFLYPTEFAMVNNFENGLAWVQKGGEDVFKNFRDAKYGYIDKAGEVIWVPTN